jgi:hypothetical protein
MSFRHAHTVTETSDTTDEFNGPAAHVADGVGLVGRGEPEFGPCALITLSGAFEIVEGQIRLVGGGHSHAIADVANLPAVLDGKADAAHTHTEADITGTIAPSKLAQAGASAGQVLKWNGTVWAPAADETGGGGGGSTDWSALTGMPAAIDAIDGLTPAGDRFAYYTGANSADLAIVTAFARTLLDDENAGAARATLGAAAASHTHAAADISDSGTTGRSVVQAATPTSAHDAAQPNVAVTSDVSLTAAAHGGRRLHVSGTRTLTVNSATGFAALQSCIIYANSGDVTIAQGTGATVTPPSGETLVIRDGCAAELRCIAPDTYRLTGGLVSA